MHADSGAQEFGEGPAESGAESEVADRRRDLIPLLFREEIDRQERLGLGHRFALGEVDDVDGCPVCVDEFVDDFAQRLA